MNNKLLFNIKSPQFREKPIKFKMDVHSHTQTHENAKNSHEYTYDKALNFNASRIDVLSFTSNAPKRKIPIGNKKIVIINF